MLFFAVSRSLFSPVRSARRCEFAGNNIIFVTAIPETAGRYGGTLTVSAGPQGDLAGHAASQHEARRSLPDGHQIAIPPHA